MRNYTPLVDIKDVEDFRTEEEKKGEVSRYGDRRNGKLYCYSSTTKLAINIALATGRPLLIIGPTGCGKSAIAFNLARKMKRKYYEFVVSSRSQARELVYRYDAVRRLGDAQARTINNDSEYPIWKTQNPYIEPGCLWWIYDPYSATKRGYFGGENLPFPAAKDPAWKYNNNQKKSPSEAVLLIDEIDKADIDFPNNLLVALGSRQLFIEEIAKTISINKAVASDPLSQPLVIITSNQQRPLPDTFVRRCVVLEIKAPTQKEMIDIAIVTYGPEDEGFYDSVAKKYDGLNKSGLNVAEYLDAIQALKELKIDMKNTEVVDKIIGNISWRSSES